MPIKTNKIVYADLKKDFKLVDGLLVRRTQTKKGPSRKDDVVSKYRDYNWRGCVYREHRLAYCLKIKKDLLKGILVDHVDGDRRNNNVSNLRSCNNAQNIHNSKTPSTNTSGTKGLGIHTNRSGNKYWRAQITLYGKKISKYCKYTPKGKRQASLWLEEQRAKLHKEFARYA